METEPYISFKLRTTFDQRKKLSDQILSRYPDRIPIIVEPGSRGKLLFSRIKYLAPKEIPVCTFIAELRKHSSRLDASAGLFFYFGGQLVPMIASLNQVYCAKSDDDGFLYVTYAPESCFGATC